MRAQGSRHCRIEDGGQVLNGIHLVDINFRKVCCGRWVQQGVGEVMGSLHGCISGGCFWHMSLLRKELDSLGCAFGAGLWNVDLVASVVFGSGAHVQAVYTMRCPGAAIGWGFKHKDSCSWGGKGRSIKVENAVELCFCRQSRVNS